MHRNNTDKLAWPLSGISVHANDPGVPVCTKLSLSFNLTRKLKRLQPPQLSHFTVKKQSPRRQILRHTRGSFSRRRAGGRITSTRHFGLVRSVSFAQLVEHSCVAQHSTSEQTVTI